jgi:hypothetical protein
MSILDPTSVASDPAVRAHLAPDELDIAEPGDQLAGREDRDARARRQGPT